MALTGVQIPTLEPGSPEWLTRMSASKVAAILGLSPYESRFSLWHRMAGLVEPEPEKDQHRRGHYLEPAIAAWFADQHPEYLVVEGGTWQHADRPWQIASPDRLLVEAAGHDEVEYGVRDLLEIKSARDAEEWGRQLTDEIPMHYRVQAVWQMDTTGARRVRFAVLTSYLDFREYVVDYDADEAAFVRERAAEFMDSLPTGPRPARPDIDEHDQTYQVVRELHPDITSGDLDLSEETAEPFCRTRTAFLAAEAAYQREASRLLDAMGSHRRALYGTKAIATRQSRGGGVPYLVAGKNLPDFPDSERATA